MTSRINPLSPGQIETIRGCRSQSLRARAYARATGKILETLDHPLSDFQVLRS